MGKVKKAPNSVLFPSVKKQFKKDFPLKDVTVKKTRRKTLAVALPPPSVEKKSRKFKSSSGWIITDEKLVNDVSKKKKTIRVKRSKTSKVDSVENAVRKDAKTTVVTEQTQVGEVNTKAIASKNLHKKNKNAASKSNKLALKTVKNIKKNKKKRTSSDAKNLGNKSPEAESNGHVEEKVDIAALEAKFNIKAKTVEDAVKGVIKLRSENPKLQNQLFEEATPLFLQINCVKIPEGYSKVLRIPLPNTMLTPDDEICLIVPDVEDIKNIRREKHIVDYEALLQKHNVTNIKKLMTLHELRTEYETFEQKARLADLYSAFLSDGRICGKVLSRCGKIFYKKRKVPVPVKLYVTKLKEHLERAVSKTFLFLHLKGDCYTVQFGHDKMTIDELVENVYAIIQSLSVDFPGSFANIKGIHVYAPRATSIPIYFSCKDPNEVRAPVVKRKLPAAYKTYTDELSTALNTQVTVKPTGEVFTKKIKKSARKQGKNAVKDKDISKANGDNLQGENTKKKRRKRGKTPDPSVVEVPTKKKKTLKPKGSGLGKQENAVTLRKKKSKKNLVEKAKVKKK